MLAKKRRSCDELQQIGWMKHSKRRPRSVKQQRGVDANTEVVGVRVFVRNIKMFRVVTSLLVTAIL